LNPLYLSGFGVSLRVDGARLIVKDGFLEPDSTQREYQFQPRRMPYGSIAIDGQTGSVSLAAIKWLMRHGVPLFILDYNGTLLSSTLPKEPVNGPLKIAQVETWQDPIKRLYIAKRLIEAKSQRTIDVLEWLTPRYPICESARKKVEHEAQRIAECNNLPRLMQVEGHIADLYWQQLQTILPRKLGFGARMHESHQMNASDPVNALLNYGYAILESECRKALNAVGLEPTVGFLHEARQTRYALVYDLMEPYRWLVDTAIIECLEYERFSKKDFRRLDNYILRLRPEAVKKLLDALHLKLDKTTRYRDKFYAWSTVIRLHCEELASYLLGKRAEIRFGNPSSTLQRGEYKILRERILAMSLSEAKDRGISKSTLWYLQQRARSERPIEVYDKIRKRLQPRNG
jgi:CRISPR-associated protein Cas1